VGPGVKDLWRLLLAPTLAAVLLLACTPTNAAHRGGGSAYDGTWSVAIYTLRGDCGSVRVAAQIVGGRVYSKDQSYQANGDRFAPFLRAYASLAMMSPLLLTPQRNLRSSQRTNSRQHAALRRLETCGGHGSYKC
jgi:hypothetical protein